MTKHSIAGPGPKRRRDVRTLLAYQMEATATALPTYSATHIIGRVAPSWMTGMAPDVATRRSCSAQE
jgi:hypothetical protein